MKFLLTLFLTVLSGLSFAMSVNLTSDEKINLPKSFLASIDYEYGLNKSYKPSNLKDEIIHFGESFYLDGYITSAGYTKIKCKIDELLKLESIIKSNNLNQRQECFLNTFSNSLCISNSTLSSYKRESNKYCASNNVRETFLGYIKTEDGKKLITKNFKLWKEIYSAFSTFVMKQVESNKASYLAQRENATAGICIEGLIRDIDYRTVVSNSCKAQSKSCSGHFDCCSGVCEKVNPSDDKGVCSLNYTCYQEIPKNNKCGKFRDGFVNSHCTDSSCLNIDYNSSDINECSSVNKTCSANTDCCSDNCVSGKCVEQSKCMVCSGSGETETTAKPCCPGLYKSIRGKCIPDFPPLILPVVKVIFDRVIEAVLPSAVADADVPKFGKVNIKAVAVVSDEIVKDVQKNQNCVPGVNCNGTENNLLSRLTEEQVKTIQKRTSKCLGLPDNEKKICLSGVSDLKKGYLAENGDDDSVWDREKYKDEYNTIAITSKTYSDVRKCEFNSFNDSWRDMSNAQRNAEMVVRGFEYVHSGNGTQDYWVNKNGKNIYSQAKEIADTLRKNRSDLIVKMKEIDISMACQCIAIFGVGKFSDAKKEFFNSDSCSDERAAIASIDIGSVDGSSQSEDDIESQEGEISEVDAGATGLSHEAILVEWLKKKYEFQMDRFEANAKVEEAVNELVQFTVEETDWEKGQPIDNELYNFTVRKLSGWLKVVIAIYAAAAIVAITIFTGGLAGAFVVSLWAAVGTTVGALAIVSISLYSAMFGKDYAPQMYDKTVRDWHCINWLCTHKDKDIKRFYVAPHYKNYDKKFGADYNLKLTDSSLKCDVRSTSSQCLKNVHKTVFRSQPRFLLDIKNPLFVNYSRSSLNTNHVNEINLSFQRGIQKLKSTAPGRTRERFLSKNFLGQKEYIEPFLIKSGNYNPSFFTKRMKEKFLSGIKKYSSCKDLVKCGAGKDYANQYGFGYLFEVEQDIIDFAEYVYQHHFHWPSLSASNFLGYPLMAQRAYLETVSYNIKLVGSFAAAQGSGYGDAYFRYQSDWETRRNAYDSLAAAKLGNATKNVKYSKEFLDTFKTLDFSVGDGVAAFESKFAALNASETGGANSFESAALSAARSKANQALASKKNRDNYLKQTKGSTRSAKKLSAQTKLLNDFGAPINNSGLTVGGTNLGNTGPVYGAGGSLSNVANQLSKVEKKNQLNKDSSNNHYASNRKFQETQFGNEGLNADFSIPGFDNHSSSSDSATAKNIKASGMSQEDIDRMLDATKKNSSLRSSEDDNLFTAVSKAYKRNYDAFFDRKTSKRLEVEEKVESIDEDKKSELKNLLNN